MIFKYEADLLCHLRGYPSKILFTMNQGKSWIIIGNNIIDKSNSWHLQLIFTKHILQRTEPEGCLICL